ncbi:MAG: hypothetical protein FKY71_04705 [Spiribacter salinus]|uniref:Uncharacterized protein n=1 Tax=Spiribacter salinus TaxID=1335746 RepID=A0A540VU06_9GAMM|nr:MAG: hypothetical protein FKY71_04705 [Spiribacter salinus]
MPAKPTHDLAIKTGEYHDRETGQMKPRWLRIGTVIRHDDGGTSIKLDCLPVGIPDWEGWVNVFKREARDGAGTARGNGQRRPPAAAPAGEGFDDDIPF